MDPNIILTLSPADIYGRAADAFRLPHNRDYYVPPAAIFDDGPSRETTPKETEINETPTVNLEYLPRIIFTFDQKVKVPGQISFGSDPKPCDIVLGPRRGAYNISYQHFCITFDHKRRPILKDSSTNGVIVRYDKQAQHERRNHFRWILFDEFEKVRVEVQIKGLAVRVHIPKHGDDARGRAYKQNVDNFMAKAPSDLDLIANIGLEGPSVPSSAVLTSNQESIYLSRRELGRGNFGKVCVVVNASTGDEYAGKEFFQKTGWEREIDIMKRLHHV